MMDRRKFLMGTAATVAAAALPATIPVDIKFTVTIHPTPTYAPMPDWEFATAEEILADIHRMVAIWMNEAELAPVPTCDTKMLRALMGESAL